MTDATPEQARARSLVHRSRHLTALVRELQADVALTVGRVPGRYAATAAVALVDLTDVLREVAGDDLADVLDEVVDHG